MEDISRELEKEIAQSKPKPYKKDLKKRVLIIDDFGNMKSGDHLKKWGTIFGFLSLIFFLATILLAFLYTGAAKDAGESERQLAIAEKKLDKLISQKEVLMARLVISGKEPGIDTDEDSSSLSGAVTYTDNQEEQNQTAGNTEQNDQPVSTTEQDKVTEKSDTAAVETENLSSSPSLTDPAEKPGEPLEEVSTGMTGTKPKIVAIKNFTVKKDSKNGNLLVRFDIQKTSTQPGDISGRIFTVLKPENSDEFQNLVVPASRLENGIPVEFRKGQYFSIAHFKPVKFRIKNDASPDYFKKASIFIFNNDGELLFSKLIDIDESE